MLMQPRYRRTLIPLLPAFVTLVPFVLPIAQSFVGCLRLDAVIALQWIFVRCQFEGRIHHRIPI